MTEKKPTEQTFEASINELEEIVNQLEDGELSLEESMGLFERGLALSYESQETLNKAEQKIQILLNNKGEEQLSPFDNSENDPS